ncbi:MAG: hypothetical protein JST94_11895 [Bacteroidetes bacterium]|nr:hypothetical protein [Bacteroidota bacterium]MBS1672128.1 hypothetical protein [Bacteroidota bacterium]
MDNEIKQLLKQILANQAVIYKRLEDLEYKIKGSGLRSASIKSYVDELKKKASEALPHIE